MASPLRRLDDRIIGDRFRRRKVVAAEDGDTRGAAGGERVQRVEAVREEPVERAPVREEPVRAERVRVDEDRERVDSKPPRNRDGLATFLAIFYRISRLVFLLLALLCLLAVILILTPANAENEIVQFVFALAGTVAEPFTNLFDLEDPEREAAVNLGVAALVYFLLSVLVTKLPTGAKRAG